MFSGQLLESLFKKSLPLLGSFVFSRKGVKSAQQAMLQNQEAYEKRVAEMNGLFNRDYYSNLLDRSDVKGLLGNLRNQVAETTRNLKQQASVTGATPEQIAATQRIQSQAYGNAVSQVASQATAWKENVLRNYLTARNAIDERHQAAQSSYMNYMFNQEMLPHNVWQNVFLPQPAKS